MTITITRRRITLASLLLALLCPSISSAEEGEGATPEASTAPPRVQQARDIERAPLVETPRTIRREAPTTRLAPSIELPAAPPAGPSLVGVLFQMLPVGTVTAIPSQGPTSSADSAFAVGVAPFLDYAVTRFAVLGISPQVIFRSNGGGDARQSATQVDVRGRLTGRAPVSPNAHLYGRFSPGYSATLLPESWGSVPTPHGIIVDFSVGAEFRVLPKMFAVVDLGYQFGFQSTLRSQYLHIGAGLAYAF